MTTAFECKKDRLYQTQDGLWKLTVTVHPNDMPDWLLKAPMGQRMGAAALHAVGDDEKPTTDAKAINGYLESARKNNEKTEGERAVQRAALMCKEREFQVWAAVRLDEARPGRGSHPPTEDNAVAYVYSACGVRSRSEIATNPDALERFKRMETDYLQHTNRMARER